MRTDAPGRPMRERMSDEPRGEGLERGNGALGIGSEEQRFGADARSREGGKFWSDWLEVLRKVLGKCSSAQCCEKEGGPGILAGSLSMEPSIGVS